MLKLRIVLFEQLHRHSVLASKIALPVVQAIAQPRVCADRVQLLCDLAHLPGKCLVLVFQHLKEGAAVAPQFLKPKRKHRLKQVNRILSQREVTAFKGPLSKGPILRLLLRGLDRYRSEDFLQGTISKRVPLSRYDILESAAVRLQVKAQYEVFMDVIDAERERSTKHHVHCLGRDVVVSEYLVLPRYLWRRVSFRISASCNFASHTSHSERSAREKAKIRNPRSTGLVDDAIRRPVLQQPAEDVERERGVESDLARTTGRLDFLKIALNAHASLLCPLKGRGPSFP